jgi:PKD domain-containing protein/FIMAH domain-containing protein
VKSSLRKSVVGSSWGRWSLAAATAAGLMLSANAPVQAAVTPDAAVTVLGVNDPVLTFQTMAQTFKAQHAGLLTEVDLHYGNQWFASAVKAQVWNATPQGTLTGPPTVVPASALVPFTTDWHAFKLSSGVAVQAGQSYAIVLTSGSAGSNRWSYNTRAGYTDGTMLVLSRGTWTSTGLASGSAFLFRTFVQTSSGLVVAFDNAAGSTASEGTAPTMTGTYSGANGTVTLQADHGTVSQGATAGTWSWTGDVYDEDTAPSSVTVTVTDASGASKSTTFPLSIKAVNPTAGITTGAPGTAAASTASLSRPEGSSLTLSGTATTPDPADQAAGFTYTWTATKDGVALGSAATGPSFTLPVDEGAYVVTVRAKDDGGNMSDPASVTVNMTEVKPTATITSIAPADALLNIIAPQETLNFSGTYSDPAPEAHTYRWDFGDGSSSPSLKAPHAYAFAGTYTVTLTVWDDEGVAGTATAQVTVQTTQQSLAAMIAYVQRQSSLNKGQQNSLVAKLNAASDASARGSSNAAHNELNAFLNELDADLNTGKITAAAYNTLRADTHAVQAALGTLNRFLEWWPPAA